METKTATDLTILMIEDDRIDVMVVQRLMCRLSIDLPIVHVGNGEEALELLRTPLALPRLTPPYVIVLDINMPRMSGFEFLDEIAKDGTFTEVPIFILSTSTNVRDLRAARRHSIHGYFVKPITATELTEVIGSVGSNAA